MNTLSEKKDEFKPVQAGHVGMYSCGPTVYDVAHLGNLRKYVFDDILRRTLEWNGFVVRHIMNITDMGQLSSDADDGEDKMTKGLKREGKPLTIEAMKELAEFYSEKFKEDLRKLNIKMPSVMPKASEHVVEDIEIIQALEKKGFVYRTSDGLYFDTSKDKDYGKLGKINAGRQDIKNEDGKNNESRIGLNAEKRDFRDFALWKFNDSLGFKSPWGLGFPGWHIECSAMALKYLGNAFEGGHFDPSHVKTIDIHTGGIDHIAIHHNNEIAQSENATGKKFVNYWLHENFLNIAGTKVSKSLGNFETLESLGKKGIPPLAYRYWLLTAHYRSPVNFSLEAIDGAKKAYERLLDSLYQWKEESGGIVNEKYSKLFKEAVNDDLNTPSAIAIMWDVVKDRNVSNADKKATILDSDAIFGLGLSGSVARKTKEKVNVPDKVNALIVEREEARKKKDWKKADFLRQAIRKAGFDVKDAPEGPKINIYTG